MKKKIIWWSLVIIIFLVYFQKLDFKNTFISDSYYKLYQTYSLVQNKIKSDEYVYPSEDIDPGYKFFMASAGSINHIVVDNKHYGQYPVFFSLLSAPVYMLLGVNGLYLFNFLPFVGLIWLLHRYWNLSLPLAILGVFITPYMSFMTDYSENMLFLFINAVGTTILLKKSDNLSRFIGAIIIGVSLWLRLEALPYMAAIGISMVIANGWKPREIIARFGEYVLIVAGFLIPIILFFAFNYFHYGHVLGPRYMSNVGFVEFTLMKKLTIAFVFLIGGFMKPGLFVYTPIFLLIFIFGFTGRGYNSLRTEGKTLLWASIFHTIQMIIMIHADPFIQWGPRYLSLIFFPLLITGYILLKEYDLVPLRSMWSGKKGLSVFFGISIFLSLLLSYVPAKVGMIGPKIMAKIHGEFESVKADVHIFDSDFLLGFIGTSYFDGKYLLVKNHSDLPSLIDNIKKHKKDSTIALYQLTSSADEGYYQRQREKSEVTKKLMDITTLPRDEKLNFKGISNHQKIMNKYLKEIDAHSFEKFTVHRYRIN